MADMFSSFTIGLESPATRVTEVTPNDTTNLPFVSRALNVAGEGTLRVTSADGDIATIYIAPGIAFPLRVSRIWATGTTATGITALF